MNEICFNLWYYLDKDQLITAIAVRQYFIGGDDQEKAYVLEALSYNDFKLVPRKMLPRALVHEYGGRVHCSALKERGVEEIFKEVFDELQTSIPPGISFPDDKLFFATPLFDFGDGYVPAEIGDGFITNKYR
jgi:hypothetical protein